MTILTLKKAPVNRRFSDTRVALVGWSGRNFLEGIVFETNKDGAESSGSGPTDSIAQV